MDATDRNRLNETTEELKQLLKDEKLAKVPILVLANKQDVPSKMAATEISENMGLVKLRDRTWQIQGTSAIDGTGLKEGLDWVCKNVGKK